MAWLRWMLLEHEITCQTGIFIIFTPTSSNSLKQTDLIKWSVMYIICYILGGCVYTIHDILWSVNFHHPID